MKTITITYDPKDTGLDTVDGEEGDLFSYLENELNAHRIKCRIAEGRALTAQEIIDAAAQTAWRITTEDATSLADQLNDAQVPDLDHPVSRLNPTTNLLDPAYRLNDREHATVLAALRHYQASGYGDMHKLPPELADIAVNGEKNQTPLDANEIDALCERLNCGG